MLERMCQQMDHRSELPPGTVLPFPAMACRLGECIGRGSNALVYEACYQDDASTEWIHRVLVKELFPYDASGHIWRDQEGVIRQDASGLALWQTHRTSFERGNHTHLRLLALQPDRFGGNLNTYSLNGTLYTVLDDSGSRSLEKALNGKPVRDLREGARRCLGLLDCLEVFHRQGYLHLDISLDNVLLVGEGPRERVLLIDYNSVHSVDEIRNGEALYFSAKEGFTAPETQTGLYRSISFCTDLFSVAAVFHALLTGKAPSLPQLSRRIPPDAGESPLLKDAPSSVREQVKRILRRGLCALPEKRYSSCGHMRKDLEELLNRVDGLGVSHAALWEAGRRSVLRLVRQNPSLAYLEKESLLYPLRVTWDENGQSVSLADFISEVSARHGPPVLLEGAGGSGKSTALLRTVLSAPRSYSAGNPAVLFLALSAWRAGTAHFLLDSLLQELRFDPDTRTMEDARHALTEQMNRPITHRGEKRPKLLLLLDGLNEAPGDRSALLSEIKALSVLPGLSMIITSRVFPAFLPGRKARLNPLSCQDVDQALARQGLLLPEKEEMRQLLQTPLLLSLFIQTAGVRETQLRCETEGQLVDDYLDALCAKAAQDGQQARYRAEAAVRLVLPAIACETRRQSVAPDDRLLFPAVVRCRKMLGIRTLSRAFPQWIGHGAEISGDGLGDDAWYGLMVHDMLWKRLGLLLRDERGGWHIRHQVLQEHLTRMDASNRSSLKKVRFRRGAFIAGLAACAALVLFLTRTVWYAPAYLRTIAPPPDMDKLTAAANRAYDPDDPDYAHLMDTLRAAEEGDVWQQYGMGILFEDGIGVERDLDMARQYYLLAASQDLPEAWLRLGVFYQNGLGVGVSPRAAAACYERAAGMGSADALVSLGVLYLNGVYFGRSDSKAFAYFQSARNRNSASGAYWLGYMYREGRGAAQSDEQAAQLFKSALQGNFAPAAEALGDLYSDENSVLKDLAEARFYYQTAADMGLAGAADKLAALPGP